MFNINSSDQNIKRTNVDYIFVGAVFLLVFIGTVMVMSAVAGTGLSAQITRTHIIAVPVAFAAFFFGWFFNYQVYQEQWKWLYGLVIVMLILVLIPGIGSYQRGSRSWIMLPFFSIQPSEPSRVAMILIASAYLAFNIKKVKDVLTFVAVFALILPIFALIMKQPDFSSIVISLPALLALLYCAGVNIFYLVLIFLLGFFAVVFPLAWTYIYLHPELAGQSIIIKIFYGLSSNPWYISVFCLAAGLLTFLTGLALRQFRIFIPAVILVLVAGVVISGFFGGVFINNRMKDYQRKRVEVFLAPSSDPKGAGYNVLQAQIAMGAGGVLGRGVFSGTQSRLGFVPEKHTDFILAVVGEELGLWGTLTVLALYFIILWRIFLIAYNSSDVYGYLVCSGIFSMFFVYACVNFGMLIGLAPVAGIPLPLISYGGSNLAASMWALGIVQSVYSRRITFR
ncbi:rod shape-determining protein RodA [Bacteroidia bacterium]|nr:rod shape-determining protein RodA [Bacteroidia bacterium]